MTKWKKSMAGFALSGLMMVECTQVYAQSITTMEQLQAQTDALIKSAQTDMQRWRGSLQLADNKQKPASLPKSDVVKQPSSKQPQRPQYMRVPRGTRTAPTAGMTGTQPKPAKSS